MYRWLSVLEREEGRTKTGDEGRVLLVEAAALLARRKGTNEASASPYVLPAPREDGRRVLDWVSERFRFYANLVGLPAHLHVYGLWHPCASWLAGAGVDLLWAIQAVMRHSDLRQTLRYASLHPDVAAARMAAAFAPLAEFGGGPAEAEAQGAAAPNPSRFGDRADLRRRSQGIVKR